MSNSVMRVLTAALLVGIALVAMPALVAAENSLGAGPSSRGGLTVIPPTTDANVNPGRTVTVQVKVDNGATLASFAPRLCVKEGAS